MTPINCKTLQDACSMPRDNIDVGDFWILLDTETGSVYLSEQPSGEPRKQRIEIPKATFDKLVRWYVTGRTNGKVSE